MPGEAPLIDFAKLPAEIRELIEVTRYWDAISLDDRQAFNELQCEHVRSKRAIAVWWDQVRDSLHTGDILLMRGKSIGSKLIRWFTGEWSHASMVRVELYNDPDVGLCKRLLLWESVSHADDCVDVLTGTRKSGVRLVDMRERLLNCDSDYFGIVRLGLVRPAGMPDAEYKRQEAALDKFVDERFRRFSSAEYMKPYEPSRFQLMRVAFECGSLLGQMPRERRSYFCSKLVCDTLVYLRLLPHEVNPARACPTDFWDYDLLLQGVCVKSLNYMPRILHDDAIRLCAMSIADPGVSCAEVPVVREDPSSRKLTAVIQPRTMNRGLVMDDKAGRPSKKARPHAAPIEMSVGFTPDTTSRHSKAQ
jgi:hypothetical protein